MTSTSEVRFGADGPAKVQSYLWLTDSTYIRCCTCEDAAPILTIQDGPPDIAITNPGRGEVTEDDVRFGRQLAEAANRYAAELEKHAANHAAGLTRTLPGRRRDDTANGGGAARAGTSGRPWVLSRMHERGDQRMSKVITGEQVAQLYNRDPFALPIWRAPVYQTPAVVTIAVQVYRLISWLVRLIVRHHLAAGILAVLALIWVKLGWLTLIVLVLAAIVMLLAWRWPSSFARRVTGPARGAWRGWRYRRRWAGVLTIAGAAPWWQGRIILPILGKVTAIRYVDRVAVRLVSGQSAADFAKCADNLAQGFGALLCRVRSGPVRAGGAGVRPP